MVQLRVDVDAANARQQFTAAARAVDQLADQLTDAQINAVQLERAMDDATGEVSRLRAEVNRLGSSAPQQLRDDLLAAERAALRARSAFSAADAQVDQLARSLDDAEDEADRLGRRLGHLDADANRGFRSVQRGLLGFIAQARQAGQQSGTALSGGIRGAWAALPAEVKGVVIIAGLAVGAAFASAAGAAIAGLLTAAIGGGVLAAGVALAVKASEQVKAAFKGVFSEVGADAIRFAKVFEGPLLKTASIFRDAWRGIAPDVKDMFAGLADAVEPLAEGIAGFVRGAMPGFKAAVAASVPLLREFARMLPDLGRAFGDMVRKIAESDGAMKGLRFVVALLLSGFSFLGTAITFLSNQFDDLTRRSEAVLNFLAKIPLVGRLFEGLAKSVADFNDPAERVNRNLQAVGGSSAVASSGLNGMKTSAQLATDEMRKLSDQMFSVIDAQLALDQANTQFNAGLMRVTESFKENGKSIDDMTAKGNANVQTVQAQIGMARQAYDAAIRMAGGENASAEAIAAANGKYNEQIAQLEGVLRKLGLTQTQIDALIGKYRAIPPGPFVTTLIEERIIRTRYQELRQQFGPGAGGPRPELGGRLRYGGIAHAASGLLNVSGRAGIARGGSNLVAFAEPGTGGEAFIARNAPRGRSLEIARAAAGWHGAQVIPNEALQRVGVARGGAGGGAAGSSYAINVYVAPGGNLAEAGRQTVEAIKAYERNSGTTWRR
jgi:hypothetical protein